MVMFKNYAIQDTFVSTKMNYILTIIKKKSRSRPILIPIVHATFCILMLNLPLSSDPGSLPGVISCVFH